MQSEPFETAWQWPVTTCPEVSHTESRTDECAHGPNPAELMTTSPGVIELATLPVCGRTTSVTLLCAFLLKAWEQTATIFSAGIWSTFNRSRMSIFIRSRVGRTKN